MDFSDGWGPSVGIDPRAIEEEREMSMTMNAGVLAGKRGLVVGVANSRSIAYGIAKQARAHGAELALTYQGDALKKRVEPLAAELGAHVVGHCDVTESASIDQI